MGRKFGIDEAVKKYDGIFTKGELYRGCKSGKYPCLRAGGPRGKIIFDEDLLEEAIQNMMTNNVKVEEPQKGIRKID